MIDKEQDLSQIKLLRLMTKEIVICSVRVPEDASENYWMLEDPFEIRSFMNSQTGDFNSTLLDWLQFTSETETKICVSDVLTCNSPESGVLEHYLELIKRKRTDNTISAHEKNEALEIIEKIKNTRESEVSFDDYMDILNNNKVYH